MIHGAVDRLVELGFNEEEKLIDDYGTIGYITSFMSQRYCVVAKEYAFQNKASFMARLVVNRPDDMDFIFYCKDDDSYTIFDGAYLESESDSSQGASKKRDCSWREISRSTGAELDDFVRNKDAPETLAGDNETIGSFA